MLTIKKKEDCLWDSAVLGEILLRFCPRDRRIQTAETFDVYDGGAEYNVARNLAVCFEQNTTIITALADNQLGKSAERLAKAGGVDISNIVWHNAAEFRNGLYFIERGFGMRPPSSCFDRSHTAVSNFQIDTIDWKKIFEQTRWFHTGGVLTGLSATTAATAIETMKIARTNGAIVSYDLNYRKSLWGNKGGREAANALNREALKFADVVFGLLDFDAELARFDELKFMQWAQEMASDFPNLQVIATTLRTVETANRHHLSGAIWKQNEIAKARVYKDCEVFDRVGSGDAFASGVIYALLQGESIHSAVEYGAASGVLAMTTAGDNLQVTRTEIENLIENAGAVANR